MKTDITAIICIFIATVIACAVFLIITYNETVEGITKLCHRLYSKKD